MDCVTVLSQPGTVTGIGGARGDQSEERAVEPHDSGTYLALGNTESAAWLPQLGMRRST
jgi:hypothetical protein